MFNSAAFRGALASAALTTGSASEYRPVCRRPVKSGTGCPKSKAATATATAAKFPEWRNPDCIESYSLPRARIGVRLEGQATDELDVPRLRYRSVPLPEAGAGGIIVERDTIPERLSVAREIVIVEEIENLHVEFHKNLLGN